MKNTLLALRAISLLLALLYPSIGQATPSVAQPATAVSTQAPTQLAWDRVGSPVRIQV